MGHKGVKDNYVMVITNMVKLIEVIVMIFVENGNTDKCKDGNKRNM